MGIVLALTMGACVPPTISGAKHDQASDDDSGDAADSGMACDDVVDRIEADGPLIPGTDVTLRAVGYDPTYGPIRWRVGDAAETTSDVGEYAWSIPADLAVHQAEGVTADVVVCDQMVSALLTVDWPEPYRAIVLYDPAVTGSEDVARYYADFREIPDENLCPVSSPDPTTLPGANYADFLATVLACTADHTHYIVPVYGVPYKVSDKVHDFGNTNDLWTVSLDALLFSGADSLDASEAINNPIYKDGSSVTQDYRDWKPVGKLRENKDFFLVTRIDGAGPEAAMALVDRTRDAQALADAGSLSGIVYVDGNRGEVEPAANAGFGSYEWGEWNMWGTRYVFEADARYEVVWDSNAEEFGTAPAPLTCPDALYYAGWYSYYNYNDAFTWAPGAVGGHLDSCSACDIRQAGTWSGSALLDGITATFGAVNEPYVSGMPEYDQFFYYLLAGANFAEAGYESTVVGQWMMVWVGDPLYRPYRTP